MPDVLPNTGKPNQIRVEGANLAMLRASELDEPPKECYGLARLKPSRPMAPVVSGVFWSGGWVSTRS